MLTDGNSIIHATGAVRLDIVRDGAWARVVLDQPKGNIITASTILTLRKTIAHVSGASKLKLLSLETGGTNFSYGVSVEDHLDPVVHAVLPEFHDLLRDLLAVPAVTLAMIRGLCLGGGVELALGCDFIFATDDAVLGLPEIELGVFPPAAAALLPLRVGGSHAARAVLTGERLKATWWAYAGLLHRVVPHATLEADANEWFDRFIAPRSAAALRHAAAAVRWPYQQAAETILPDLERRYLAELMRTHDANEGIAAFLERRPARWTHA